MLLGNKLEEGWDENLCQSQINLIGIQMEAHLVIYNAILNWHLFVLRILKQLFPRHLFSDFFFLLLLSFSLKHKPSVKLTVSSLWSVTGVRSRLDMHARTPKLRRRNRTCSLKIIFLFWLASWLSGSEPENSLLEALFLLGCREVGNSLSLWVGLFNGASP